jgi:hypothetical protein
MRMKRSSAVATAVILFAAIGLCVGPARGQCNPTCPGDFNQDGKVSIDELVTAVNSALDGCEASPQQEGCLATGGVVTTQLCCAPAPDFPDTCVIGACACSPAGSRALPFCHCDPGYCFDRSANACVANQG